MKIKTVGVVGMGQMGKGIAEVLSIAGYQVIAHDSDASAQTSVMDAISHDFKRLVEKKRVDAISVKEATKKIVLAKEISELGDCDLIVEAATENENTKKEIFSNLEAVLKDEAILTTNTSSISVTRLAAATNRPNKFMGLHFMNPVTLMNLVELVRGIATDDETFDIVKDVVFSLGKTYSVSEDFPAFIVNRILMPMINEAIYCLYEGVGNVRNIDLSMKLGANHRMGPLELADFIGLDTCLSIMNVLHEGLGDTKYRPCPLLVKYVEAGWLGQKTKKGFYDYGTKPPEPTR